MIVRNASARAAARGGFTLTEMLVVVAIIVVLAAIAVPITMGVLSESKSDIARAHIKGTLLPAVKQYQIRNPGEEYPGSLEELVVPSDGKAGILRADALLDPWGRPYLYVNPGTQNPYGEPDIYSQGPRPGDPTSIIGNWQIEQ